MTKRIVIADDTLYMRSLIRETLKEAGFRIIAELEDGAAAVAGYRQHQPDAMILNLMMPKLGGLEALRQITSWDPNANIIICSAHGQASAVLEAIQAGAREFVVKPFDAARLLEVVNRVLESRPPVY